MGTVLCEICGNEAFKAKVIRLDSSEFVVCNRCSDYGEYMGEYDRMFRAKPVAGLKRRFTKKEEESCFELVQDYPAIVRAARERLGLTQEAIAKKINESHSVIRRLETGRMAPSEEICRKLERTLGIVLEENSSHSSSEPEKTKRDEEASLLTLGDVVKIKKKEK